MPPPLQQTPQPSSLPCPFGRAQVYTMPSETASEQQAASLPPSHADQSYPVHEMTRASLALSRDGSLLATGGADGEVSVRSTANMGDVATISLHDVLARWRLRPRSPRRRRRGAGYRHRLLLRLRRRRLREHLLRCV